MSGLGIIIGLIVIRVVLALNAGSELSRMMSMMKKRASLVAFVMSFLTTLPAAATPHGAIEVNGLGELDYLLEQIETEKEIELIAHELHYLLEQQGYILSFPKVVNEKTVEVWFGQITTITVEGFSQNTSAKIRDYFTANISDKPLVSEIDRALALTNDIPGVEATVAFRKDDNDGNYEAVITGAEVRQSGQVSVDTVSRSVSGDTRFQILQNFNSIIQGGDLVRLQGTFVDADDTSNQRSVYGSYMFPIGSLGTFAEVSAGDFQTEVSIEGTSSVITTNAGFVILPASSTNHDYEGQSVSFTLGHPIMRSHDKARYILASVDWSDDETATVGDAEHVSGDLSLFDREEQSSGQSYAAGVTLGGGHTDSFRPQDTGGFGYLQGSFGTIQPLEVVAPQTELRIELYGQLGTIKTPSSKLIGLGSEQFLRGYENGTFVGETGARGSVEVAHSFYFRREIANQVTPLAFIDLGAVRNDASNSTSVSRPQSDVLASAGLGLRANIGYGASVEGFIGFPLMEDASGKTPAPRAYIRLAWGW